MERDQASKFINDLLRLMVARKGSDLFITADFPVFQVQADDTRAEGFDHLVWFFVAAQRVAGVHARADQPVMPFDGVEGICDFVVSSAGSVVMDSDGDLEFFAELIEDVKGIGFGVRGQYLYAECFSKLEFFTVQRFVESEAFYAVAWNADAGLSNGLFDLSEFWG